MLGDLIGAFKGKNTAYRILSDGKSEVSGQGNGKYAGQLDLRDFFTSLNSC